MSKTRKSLVEDHRDGVKLSRSEGMALRKMEDISRLIAAGEALCKAASDAKSLYAAGFNESNVESCFPGVPGGIDSSGCSAKDYRDAARMIERKIDIATRGWDKAVKAARKGK